MNSAIYYLKQIKKDCDFEKSNNYLDDGLLDSLDVIKLISLIETELKIDINPEDIDPDNFVNAESINSLINKYKN